MEGKVKNEKLKDELLAEYVFRERKRVEDS